MSAAGRGAPRVAGDHRVEDVLARLRAAGGRSTSARRAVVQALVDSGGHLDAEAVADAIQRTHPDVHRSTVYRILDALERVDVVRHVHLGHGPAVYHFADEPHHHLVCHQCGAVTEVPAALLDGVAGRLQESYGFELDADHFALSGRCRRCRAS